VSLHDVAESADHRLDGAGRRARGSESGAVQGDETAGPPAALRPRIAEPRRHRPHRFQWLQRGVDVGAAHGALRALRDVVRDRDGVGFVGPQPERREQDEQLELAERSSRHRVTPRAAL
jgi:hypothetical protein